MKEVISVINNAFIYENKVVDEIIYFIKHLDSLNILSDMKNNELQLINNILIYKKEEELKYFIKWLIDLDLKYNSDLNEKHSKLVDYLTLIVNTSNNNINGLLRSKNQNNEYNLFLKLIIPIKAFDELHLSQDEKFEVELIDFPGLNSENNLLDRDILTQLIKFSNGFIFVTKCSINEGDTCELINTIINKIENRKKRDFSFDSILFVLTFWEKLSHLNLEEKENDINIAINSSDLSNSFILNQKKFLITKFSNNYYHNFLNDKNICENIDKLYLHLKKNNKYEVNEINFVKKLKKDLKEKFLDKLNNKNENKISYENNEFNDNKKKLIQKISPKSLTTKYDQILNEIVKKYMELSKNINHHQDYIDSNAPEFFVKFMRLIKNSRKSYNKSLEKTVINLALYIQDKLIKINWSFILEKANIFIKDQEKNEKINKINNISKNTIEIIDSKINSYKQNFENEISLLSLNAVQNKLNNDEIQEFCNKWKIKNEKLQEDIGNDIIDFSTKIEEKIPVNSIIEISNFEKQANQTYFDTPHIIAHGIALGLEGIGGGITSGIISFSAPGIGWTIGACILIHLGICLIKYKIDVNKEKKKLVQNIMNYSNNFMDNLSSFQNDIINHINKKKDELIYQINDNYALESLKFDEEEKKRLKVIIKAFEEKLKNFFKIVDD